MAACGEGESPDVRKARLDLEKAEADLQQARQDSFVRSANLVAQVSEAFDRDAGRGSPVGRQACIAAISEVMSEPTSIMRASGKDAANYGVRYRRADGENWSYVCQVTGDRVRWATNENGEQGPWRFGENIRFKVDAGDLVLTMDEFGEGDKTYRYDLQTVRPKQ